jgi:hypothetical protein
MRDTGCEIQDSRCEALLTQILKKTLFIFHLCSFIFLLGCSAIQNKETPAWVLQPQEFYPRSQYLSAVGEGDTRRAAENSAAAGLARIFKSSINATETLSETARETNESLKIFSELRNDVSISSQEELINIQFGDAYTAPDGRVYTVALLPRAETATILRQRMGDNNQNILQQLQQTRQINDPLKRYALLRSVARKTLENERILDQLDVLVPGSTDRVSLPYSLQETLAEASSAAQNITFSVSLRGEAGMAVREALAEMGFSEKDEWPTLWVRGQTKLKSIDLKRDGLAFVRTSYEVQVQTRDQAVIIAFNNSLREGHLSKAEASDRAARALYRDLKDTLQHETIAFLNRLV